MCRLYRLFRAATRRWLLVYLTLIGATFVFGLLELAKEKWQYDASTDLYLVSLLFSGSAGELTEQNVDWQLDVARWLGFSVWFLTVAAVLVKLFAERVLRAFVRLTARNHIIVAGLCKHGDQLVRKLLAEGRDVVVLESAVDNPGIDGCREQGAVILVGDADSPLLMKRACLSRADRLLVLFDDDRDTLRVITTAFELLQPDVTDHGLRANATSRVQCVAKINEPGLTEFINRHELRTNSDDDFGIAPLNVNELAASAMLSRARWATTSSSLSNIGVLGLGSDARLAESLVLRIAKDQLAEYGGCATVRVFDPDAREFVEELTDRFPFIREGCQLISHTLPFTRAGIGAADPELDTAQQEFDAIFVCLDDESQSAVQTSRLAQQFSQLPIIVRTDNSCSGLGALLGRENAGGLGANIHPIGVEDLILDPDTVLNPHLMLLARACHENYLLTIESQIQDAKTAGDHDKLSELKILPAYVPWERLPAPERASNLQLATSLLRFLRSVDGRRKKSVYGIAYRKTGYVGAKPDDIQHLTPDEVEFLAEQEHERWMEEKRAAGYVFAAARNDELKHHPCLLPFEELPEHEKYKDRDFFQNLPTILARADLLIKREGEASTRV